MIWKEKQSKWKFRRIVKAEKRKKAKVRIRKNKPLIHGKWWF